MGIEVMTNEREEQIRKRAQEIWESEGRPEGRDEKHWRRAEEELDNRTSGAGTTEGAAEAAQPGSPDGSSAESMRAGSTISEGTKPDGAPPAQAQTTRRGSSESEAGISGGSSPDAQQATPMASQGPGTTSEGTKPDGAPPAPTGGAGGT